MAEFMDRIPVNVAFFHKARQKFDTCDNAEKSPHYIGGCTLYNYTFDTANDIAHHCSSCRTNTKEPTTKKLARMG